MLALSLALTLVVRRPELKVPMLSAGSLTFVVVMGMLTGRMGVPIDPSKPTSPGNAHARDRRGMLYRVGFGALAGILIGSAAAPGFADSFAAGLATGFASGFALGLALSFLLTSWPSYTVSRLWLAAHHKLPWRLMDFLEDAHQRGVFRQVGSVYQFRHIDLQRGLASRPEFSPVHPGQRV